MKGPIFILTLSMLFFSGCLVCVSVCVCVCILLIYTISISITWGGSSCSGYLGLALFFVRNSALRETLSFYEV